ncbi:polysaccharide pyruvyl transferase family protein [Microbacterium sp. GXF0217]
MRILVAWAGEASPNLGVRALGRGSEDLLRQIWPDAEFTWMDFGNRPEAVPWGRPRSLIKERVLGRSGMMDWLAQFDLYWDTRSGDSFADIYGASRHAKMSLLHEFAAQAGARTILAPQTIGPFDSWRGRSYARRNLHRSSLAFARDPQSANAAAELGRPVDVTATDLVFGIRPPEPEASWDVLLNVSGLLWRASDHVDNERYRRLIRALIPALLAQGRRVTLLPHVLDSHDPDNDVPVSFDLQNEFDGLIDVHVPADLDDARSTIAGAQLVIGARMHACLNALSTGTPAVAMAYSRKFGPLMHELGWDQVITLADASVGVDDVMRAVNTPGAKQRALEAQAAGQALLEPVSQRLSELS